MKKFLAIGSAAVLALVALLFALGGEPNAKHDPLKDASSARADGERSKPLAESLPLTANAPVPLPSADEPNATRALAEQIAKDLLAKNPKGPSLFGGASALTADSPEALVDGLLSQEIENADYAAFAPTVRTTELKVVADTPEAAAAFAEQFSAALNPFLTSSIPTDNPTPAVFIPIAAVAQKAANDLYRVPVPAPRAALLAKAVEFLKAQEAIFSSLANAEADPLRAFLAFQIWPEKKQGLDELYVREIAPFLAQNGINQPASSTP